MTLTGKTAIVTGAAGGIGKGIAEVFVERGAHVVIADVDEAGGAATAAQLGDAATFIQCNVADEASVKALANQCDRIDVLVNNAGVNFVKPFDEMTVAEWDHVISVDLRGTFLCTHACIDRFLEQGSGSVINIASVHSYACYPGAAPYDAAKWGVVGMTKSLAVEYASRNVRFNCLSPGLIDTQIWQDMLAAVKDVDACMAHWRANIPAGRVGTPREMGLVAAFLASDDASYVTGANLIADGGLTSQLISKEQ